MEHGRFCLNDTLEEKWNIGILDIDCCDELCHRTTKCGWIQSFTSFSQHFDWDKENTYSWHGAFHPYVILGAIWDMICWGKMALLWGKMEQRSGAKWHTLTNACPSNLVGMFWWIHCSMFSIERVRMSNFNASMVVHMNNGLNESQIGHSYSPRGKMVHSVPFYLTVGTKWYISYFLNFPILIAYLDILL